MNTHRKPHKCGTCGKGFGLRADLNRHVKARHRLGNTTFKCEVPDCTSTFARKDNVKQHLKKYHHNQLEPGHKQGCQVARTNSDTDDDAVSTTENVAGEPLLKQHWWRMAAVGNVAVLSILLEAGCDVNMSADDGNTALHCAAQAGQTAAVEFLLEKGAQVNVRNKRFGTPLFEAAIGGNSDAILILLRAGGTVSRFEPSPWGAGSNVPAFVDYVVASGDPHLIQEILNLDTPQLNKDRGAKAVALAVAAAKAGKVTILQSLSVSDPRAFNPYRKFRPIHHAVSRGHLEAVRMLMVPTGIPNIALSTPTFLPSLVCKAAQKGYLQILQLLLDCDPSIINSRNRNAQSPLHLATSKGHMEVVQYLLSCPGIDVGLQQRDSDTALHIAARHGHIAIIQALMSHGGVDLAQRGQSQETPLLAAFWRNQLEAVKVLSNGDASVLEAHETCLDVTSLNTVAQRLLEKGVLTYEDEGINPMRWWEKISLLYLAAEFGDIELARYVLMHEKLDPEQFTRSIHYTRDFAKETAQQAAQRKGHDEVAELIEDHKAKHASNTPTLPSLQQLCENIGIEMLSPEQRPGMFDHDLQSDFDLDFDMEVEDFDFDFDSFLHNEPHEEIEGRQIWMDSVMAG